MKKLLISCAIAVVVITTYSSASLAAGFRLPDQDAAAMGMAGAFVAQADNPSAAWYNPAGIIDLDGTRISAGVIAIYPVLSHDNTDGTTDVSERSVFLPVELFATDKVNDRVSLGLGITSPFGLSTNWSETSATADVATFSRVKTIDINPDIAYKISDTLSAAVGLDYMILQATMNKLLFPGGPNFRLDGKGEGLGANAGIKYKATEQLNLGLSYRSRIKVKVDDATAEVNAIGLSGSAQTEITLPDLIQFGGSYKFSDKLTLNADLEYTWWSTYDRLIISSSQPAFNATAEKDWKNTWTIRIGGQYRLSDQWKLRAGYVYDQSPVTSSHFDTAVPDSDRQGLTIGTGYTSGNIAVDASYMYLMFKNRTINDSLAGGSTPVAALDGTYKGTAQLIAITIGYKF